MSLLSSRHDSKAANGPSSNTKPPKLPGHHKTITTGMSLLRNVRAFLTPTGGSQTNLANGGGDVRAFTKAKTETDLFTATKPEVDGEECLRDCDACTVHYPAKFKIDEDDALYGHVKGWSTHLIVGTGKTDWVRDVADEKGSVMQAVGRVGVERRNGKVMLSASNMAPSEFHHHGIEEEGVEVGSDCLLLPAWIVVEDVKPSQVDVLMKEVIETSVTNSSPVGGNRVEGNGEVNGREVNGHDDGPDVSGLQIGGETATPASTPVAQEGEQEQSRQHERQNEGLDPPTLEPATIPLSISTGTFKTRPIPHSHLILMCSHKTRDARCGQSAPLLRKEFERILRPLGLYRDLHDDRPGGVGIYFINHVGGHKYSANVMIYRRETEAEGEQREEGKERNKEAVQLIWLARVRPEDCENIVRYTILQGKVVKPRRQLRGGFDRARGLTSW